jgi:predicted transcriptional regulator
MPYNDCMDIPKLLEKRKGERSWGDLSAELGVSRMTLYNIYNGFTEPSNKLLKALGLKRVQKVVRANGT